MKRQTRNIVEKRIYDVYGDKILLLDCDFGDKKSKFKSNVCGHIWYSRNIHVLRGNGCQQCGYKRGASKNRKSFGEVKAFIESKNCTLLSETYINTKTPLKIKFNSCGHICDMSFDFFIKKSDCTCTAKDRFKKTISDTTKDKILNAINSVNFKLISFSDEIVNWETCISYQCPNSHIETKTIRSFMRRKNCSTCTMIWQRISQTGPNGNNWQGGLMLIRDWIRPHLKDWKKESIKNSNYKCVISGKRFQDIHHIQSLNLIIKESLNELNIDYKERIGGYTEEELFKILIKIQEIHSRYPLGVALTRKWHNKFHQIYGIGDNTPQQWNEFLFKVSLNEITLDTM